jgi:2-dehydropantoate 2-reductase
VAEAASPHVVILGTGAMACLFGARLARFAAARVTLVGTWQAGLDQIAAHGLRLEDESGDWRAPAEARRLGQDAGSADLVLVLVKSQQTQAIAPWAARCEGPILTLQNGLGNGALLAAAAGKARVLLGTTTAGARLLGPAHVRTSSLGLTSVESAPAAVQVVQLLRDAGFPAAETSAIHARLWRKLAANCAINALSALRGVPNGALLGSAQNRSRLEAAAREVAAVAAALGFPLDQDGAEIALEVARATAGNRSSMLQDLERGVATEIDALNGAVVREGRRVGVPTPVNEALWTEILARQGTPAVTALQP